MVLYGLRMTISPELPTNGDNPCKTSKASACSILAASTIWPQSKPTDELLLYDAKDLTTHAVCVGMTGSGKTGLCLALLEEAAIDGIPAIVIDPKGDLGNLLLTFPQLRPEDFRAVDRSGRGHASGRDAGRSSPPRRPSSGGRAWPSGGRTARASSGSATPSMWPSTRPAAAPACR